MKVWGVIGATVVTVAATLLCAVLWGAPPRPTQMVNPPALTPHTDRPAYQGRLNLISMDGRSNPALAFYRRPVAVDIIQIEKDLCNGRSMDEDLYFRQVRSALIINSGSLCPGSLRRLRFVAPLSVLLGKGPGVTLTVALTALLSGMVAWIWYGVWKTWRARSLKVLSL